ncbi:hypothetical protein JD844_016359 [Phrynosoma platyrhinos]|uniref:Transmembrane protein 241 n=1 Tax=Phrynosoma platyrhinos TaxID=52577 RepID=A0ABQ7SKD6_PHRPL|nr:hypothetical protein JD844_016359 [Phrynosoma platyrhinos]
MAGAGGLHPSPADAVGSSRSFSSSSSPLWTGRRYLSLVLVLFWAGAVTLRENLHACKESEYHYEYTACNSLGSRWRVAVPHTPGLCTGLPDPIKGTECSFSCTARTFLDMKDQSCKPCSEGTYSLGTGIRFDEWDELPHGFASVATNLEIDYSSTESLGNCTMSTSEVLSWLPASALFVGIIYSGSRALSRLPIPIFLTLHNAAEVITYGTETFVQKEQISAIKICRMLTLLVAAGCLPLYDPQFDTDGYFWAFMHVLSVGAYKVYHKSWKPSSLSISEQQYINYAFSVVMLAFASHPTGDLFSALEFPFLYFYRFHSSCFASGVLGFFLTFHTIKLKNNTSTGQYAAWSFLAKRLGSESVMNEISGKVTMA